MTQAVVVWMGKLFYGGDAVVRLVIRPYTNEEIRDAGTGVPVNERYMTVVEERKTDSMGQPRWTPADWLETPLLEAIVDLVGRPEFDKRVCIERLEDSPTPAPVRPQPRKRRRRRR